MGFQKFSLLVILLCAGSFVLSCASQQGVADARLAELQGQLVELQKSQTGLAARMDEIQSQILVLQEAGRLNKTEIDRLKQTATSPTVTIRASGEGSGRGDERSWGAAMPSAAVPAPVLEPTTGRGGEFVAPPPGLDPALVPTANPSPAPILPAGGCRVDPPAAVRKDPLFGKAWKSHGAGAYAMAVFEWNETLVGSKNPDVLVAAKYFLGDAYFQLKEYGQAAALFRAVFDEAEGSPFGPCAAYRAGVSLEMGGRPDQAAAMYRVVIQKHPGSDAARMAKERLAGLDSTTSR